MCADHIPNQFGIAFWSTFSRVAINHEVLALDVAKAAQLLEKGAVLRWTAQAHFTDFESRANEGDPLWSRRLLRLRREWHRGHAHEKRNELAPLHVPP